MSGIVGMSSNVRTKLSHDMYTKLISIQHRGLHSILHMFYKKKLNNMDASMFTQYWWFS